MQDAELRVQRRASRERDGAGAGRHAHPLHSAFRTHNLARLLLWLRVRMLL